MSAEAEVRADTEVTVALGDVWRRVRARGSRMSAVWVIVALQAAWLGILMARGWYYQDDLDLLAEANGRRLSAGYLTEPANNHLTPGIRLIFWALHPLQADQYWVTILARLALQALATLLLYRLLVHLIGASRLALLVVCGYAFSPMLIGAVWLSCAAGSAPAQVLVLLGFLGQVNYIRTGRFRSAAGAGLAFGAAATFLELSVIQSVLIVPLALGFVYEGSLRQRLTAALRHWAGWLLAALPLAAFVVVYALGSYGGGRSRPVSANTLARFVWEQWSRSLAPMAAGGPWRFVALRDVYFSATDPATWAVVVTQIVVGLVLVAGVLRTGYRALVAWSLPATFLLLCSVVLLMGRFWAYGLYSAHAVTYMFGAAVPCALAVALAFHDPTPRPHRLELTAGWRGALVPLGVVALVASSAVSSIRFTNRWAQSPAEAYVSTLRHDLGDRPSVLLYDTAAPLGVLDFLEPRRHISDLVGVLGRSARFRAGGGQPDVVDQHGHVVPASFVPVSRIDTSGTNALCNDVVQSTSPNVQPFPDAVEANEWILDIQYFQPQPSIVYVDLIDRQGRTVHPAGGSRIVLTPLLGGIYLRFPNVRPAALSIRGASPTSLLCITDAMVGTPFPAKASR